MKFSTCLHLITAGLALLSVGCTTSKIPLAQPPQPQTVQPLPPPAMAGKAGPNHLALAKDLVDKEFYEVALVQLKSAMDKRKSSALVYDLAGVCARETGDLQAAEIYLRKARAMAPENASVHNNLGILYTAVDQLDQSEVCFRQAVLLDPGRADFQNNLGYHFMVTQDYGRAETQFKKALALEPSFEAARNNLILALGLQFKDHQTMALLMAAKDPQAAWHNMACIYTMRGEKAKADQLMEFVRFPKESGDTSVFDLQARQGRKPDTADPTLPGNIADIIYSNKYTNTMKSDSEGVGSGQGGD